MSLLIITLLLPTMVLSQEIEIQNLNDNNGFIIVKDGPIIIIRDCERALHIIKISQFEENWDQLQENIMMIKKYTNLDDPAYLTMTHNFHLLELKIDGLKPHTHKSSKRGLINVLGSTIKFITGNMDNEDKEMIQEKLDSFSKSNSDFIHEPNKQISINNQLAEQIKNISNYITQQQKPVIGEILCNYINKFPGVTNTKEELDILKHIFQINYDVTILRNHIDDIEQIILSTFIVDNQ